LKFEDDEQIKNIKQKQIPNAFSKTFISVINNFRETRRVLLVRETPVIWEIIGEQDRQVQVQARVLWSNFKRDLDPFTKPDNKLLVGYV